MEAREGWRDGVLGKLASCGLGKAATRAGCMHRRAGLLGSLLLLERTSHRSFGALQAARSAAVVSLPAFLPWLQHGWRRPSARRTTPVTWCPPTTRRWGCGLTAL